MTKKLMVLAATAILMFPAAALNAQQTNWVHIRVDGDQAEQVRLNLPMSMVSMAFETIREEGLDDIADGDFGLADAREMWQALRDAGDAEFVNVQDGDESLRVYREGDRLYIEAQDGPDENLRVEMPVRVADVLLSPDSDAVDFDAVVQELIDQGDSDLVLIQAEDRTVRFWVDNQSTQD